MQDIIDELLATFTELTDDQLYFQLVTSSQPSHPAIQKMLEILEKCKARFPCEEFGLEEINNDIQ